MKKRTTLTIITSAAALILAGALLFGGAEAALAGEATLYKSPNCGCCSGYADFLSREGVDVTVEQTQQVRAIKDEHGVPHDMESCHTTVMEGYVIEGHVPGYAVEQLLEERPDIAGIALPGMPTGVPGMPGPHEHATIHALHHDGSTGVFMQI